MILSIAILTFVTTQRLGELWLARRNTARLLAKGAHEVGAGHYPLIVGLHASWLAGLWWLAWDRSVIWPWLAVFAVLQALRVGVLATLGERWTTRIIVLPGTSLVKRGPYRFFSHPNYLIVVGEIAALPLAFGLIWLAAVFSLLNLLVLTIRIRAENRELKAAQTL
ncbi:MAG: isoprenylcysteine carboxyl methyltransferase family protein [Caulobacteraceae bacterium]